MSKLHIVSSDWSCGFIITRFAAVLLIRRPCCYNFLFVDYLDNKMLSSVNHAKLSQVFALVCPFYEENEVFFFGF